VDGGTLEVATSPARLLQAVAVDSRRQLGRDGDIDGVRRAPAAQEGPIREVEVLGQGRAPPAAGIVDRDTPPDPRGAVEVEPVAATPARLLLDREVPVDGERLDPRQQGCLAVGVIPARLDEREARIRDEDRDQPPEEVGRGDEVGVEQRDELTRRRPEACRQGPGLVPAAVRPVAVSDPDPAAVPAFDGPGDDRGRLVRRVVEDLDLDRDGVLEPGDGVDQAAGDVALVVDRQTGRSRSARRSPPGPPAGGPDRQGRSRSGGRS
jgi:hypothetical protein